LKSISGRAISTVKSAPLAGMGTKVWDRMLDVQNLGLYFTLFFFKGYLIPSRANDSKEELKV
jgi:hypothetical protein